MEETARKEIGTEAPTIIDWPKEDGMARKDELSSHLGKKMNGILLCLDVGTE